MKTIGLIGGLSWESTACYYRVMNREVRAQLGGWHSSRVILDSLDFQPFAVAQNKAEFSQLRHQLTDSAQRLEQAGAELILIACNTVHRFAGAIEEAIRVPFLHIGDAAGYALSQDGHQKVGLLGTRATMEGAFYRQRLKKHFNIDLVVPERNERHELHRLIVEDLNGPHKSAEAAPRLDRLIESFAAQGASAVLLACTELGLALNNQGLALNNQGLALNNQGLALNNQDTPMIMRALPAYDTAVLHALAAVDASLGLNPPKPPFLA